MNQPISDIRGVLIQVEGTRLLLPNAVIAEVLSFADPEPVENAPDWLLGRIRWRGWQLPLVAFSRLAGIAEEHGGIGSKVVVMKSLGDDARAPYFALLTKGFPRLVTVPVDALVEQANDAALVDVITHHVHLHEDDAVIPNLERVQSRLAEALQRAA